MHYEVQFIYTRLLRFDKFGGGLHSNSKRLCVRPKICSSKSNPYSAVKKTGNFVPLRCVFSKENNPNIAPIKK